MANTKMVPDGVSVWNKILTKVMDMPGVMVDREKFLRKELSRYCKTQAQLDKVVALRPSAVFSVKVIDSVAGSCINYHRRCTSALSFVAGFPGGWGMAGTVPADLAQYYFHAVVLIQKLAYLYGWPSLTDEKGELIDEAGNLITVFVGVMMGVAAANAAIKKIAQRVAIEAAKRLPRIALTKVFLYPLAKQVLKWVGVKLTKDLVGKTAGKVIPYLGGPISGGLTYVTFSNEAARLKKKLREDMYLFDEADENGGNQ